MTTVDDLSPANRPVNLRELAAMFGMSAGRMKGFLDRHRINPACRIGRTRVYGPAQIGRVFVLLECQAAGA